MMFTTLIAAALAAAAPAPAQPADHSQHGPAQHEQHGGMKDCCKDCCADMADASKAKPCCAEHDKGQAAHNSH